MKTEEMNLPIRSFKQSLFNDDIKELSINFSEIGLDQLASLVFEEITDDIIREIPIVQSIYVLGRTAIRIKDYFNLKKQLSFIQALQKGNPNQEGIKKRLDAAKRGEKWLEKEAEITAIYLERQADVEKAIIMADLYTDLLNEKITFSEYQDYLGIIDQLFLSDIGQLTEYLRAEKEKKEPFPTSEGKAAELIMCKVIITRTEYIRCNRLLSLGLLYTAQQVKNESMESFTLTRLGRYLAELIYKTNLCVKMGDFSP